MSYIAIHRWNETVGMKVLGMSDALTSPISSLRLPRPGFLASAKANPSPSFPLVFESVDRGLFPSPVFFFLLFKRIQKNSLIPKSNYLFFVIFVQIVLKKNYYRNIIITLENSSLESLKQNFK